MLSAALEDSGFRTYNARTLKAAKEFLNNNDLCLMVLDLHLPDGNGLDLCCLARSNPSQGNVPIIALTGRDELQDKKKGFIAGVDQYLTKPIKMDELIMWVKALLRRVDMDKSGGGILATSDLQLDPMSQLVKYKTRPIENLTRREFQLLYALVKYSPRIVSRQEIISNIWCTVSVDNLVDTHMFNLRNKLPPELSERIQAMPGKGFRYLDVA